MDLYASRIPKDGDQCITVHLQAMLDQKAHAQATWCSKWAVHAGTAVRQHGIK